MVLCGLVIEFTVLLTEDDVDAFEVEYDGIFTWITYCFVDSSWNISAVRHGNHSNASWMTDTVKGGALSTAWITSRSWCYYHALRSTSLVMCER